MKSFLLRAAARRQPRHDEEEGAASSSSDPPPSPCPPPKEDPDGAPPPLCTSKQVIVVDDGTDGGDLAAANGSGLAEKRQSTAAAKQQAWWWWWSSAPTRGVGVGLGLVVAGLVFVALLAGTTIRRLDYYSSAFLLGGGRGSIRRPHHHVPSSVANLVPVPFNCGGNETHPSSSPLSPGTCRRRHAAAASPSPSVEPRSSSSERGRPAPPRCPDYFRYIHSDLSPWREAGITREAVERGRGRAAFRLVVLGGRAYVEAYHRVFQTRDSFTLWGIAQLLARYPGRVPDLDLMFNCEDMPELQAADFPRPSEAPPLFRYCKDDATLDIVFPDWSFWGWPEVNVRPWAPLLQEMDRETRRLPWPEREPYAHWKGNPGVSTQRADLLRCNVSDKMDWNARLFRQDWNAAIRGGFKDSNLAKQCAYRYKIFVQGRSWSVSEKYILACDSPMLLVATPYKDFFSRGLVAGKHYWPIDPARKCPSVKFAVDWGNAHPAQAQRMAEEGSSFAREEMSMDYVYDYMLHLLTEYARLLRYKPTIPESAVELCPESLACAAQGRERQFMMESRERFAADYEPCTLPPPFTAGELRDMARREEEVLRKVKRMEKHS
ncbi:hypothetical protein SEVIR_7G018500v4 [Setaria viridis]|uniref:Glycosyl transferase CAP10 domain-containing protein n=1 Tax=Setaria viridis TaxID=4556 RepID=A0A4U6TPV9_SETVI|nr:O-glucosyltransferase rumi-like [Setaria viridis]TKW03355.1 hypothetical protein SEVIR_7G018500v2 [Setaria viridis]